MEEEVDSRFVSNLNNNWSAEHGPFDEEKFANLGQSHWSFIVQAANHWHQPSAQLVEPFKQLPNWLFDDLMISYSVEGGGVGPHIDSTMYLLFKVWVSATGALALKIKGSM